MPINISNTVDSPRLSKNPIYYEYTSSGVWAKPTNPEFIGIFVTCAGAGGGGGSGRSSALSTNRSGGGGGGGGTFVQMFIPASNLSSTHSITVGIGGSGGAAINTIDSEGIMGNWGGTSIFQNIIIAGGGTGGAGGTTQGASGGGPNGNGGTVYGNVVTPYMIAGSSGGGASSVTMAGAAGGNGFTSITAGAGGGGGGGQRANQTIGAPAVGGSVRYQTSAGTYGTLLSAPATVTSLGGTPGNSSSVTFRNFMINFFSASISVQIGAGGTGGAYSSGSLSTPGGNGGNGGGCAGGGGGGGVLNGVSSGKGGDGGNGFCAIIEIYGAG